MHLDTPPLPLRAASRLWGAGAAGHGLWAIGVLAVGLGDADPRDQAPEPATEAVCAALLVLVAGATTLQFLPEVNRWLRSPIPAPCARLARPPSVS